MESGSILLPTLIIVSVVCSSRRILRIIMWVLGLHPSYFLAKHGMCRRCIIIILFSSEEWHISRPCIPHLLQTLIWWIVYSIVHHRCNSLSCCGSTVRTSPAHYQPSPSRQTIMSLLLPPHPSSWWSYHCCSHSLLAFPVIANMLSASRFFIGLKHGGEFRWQEAVEGGVSSDWWLGSVIPTPHSTIMPLLRDNVSDSR